MAGVPGGQAELLVSRGIAKPEQQEKQKRVESDSNSSDRTNIRAGHRRASTKAS